MIVIDCFAFNDANGLVYSGAVDVFPYEVVGWVVFSDYLVAIVEELGKCAVDIFFYPSAKGIVFAGGAYVKEQTLKGVLSILEWGQFSDWVEKCLGYLCYLEASNIFKTNIQSFYFYGNTISIFMFTESTYIYFIVIKCYPA